MRVSAEPISLTLPLFKTEPCRYKTSDNGPIALRRLLPLTLSLLDANRGLNLASLGRKLRVELTWMKHVKAQSRQPVSKELAGLARRRVNGPIPRIHSMHRVIKPRSFTCSFKTPRSNSNHGLNSADISTNLHHADNPNRIKRMKPRSRPYNLSTNRKPRTASYSPARPCES